MRECDYKLISEGRIRGPMCALNIASLFIDYPAQQFPSRLAVLGAPDAITYGELGSLTSRVANALCGLNCSPRDRVLIALPDSIEFIASFFGAVRMGAIAVPISPRSGVTEFRHYVDDSEPHVVVVHAQALPMLLPSVGSRRTKIIVVGNEENGSDIRNVWSWKDCTASGGDLAAFPSRAEDPAFFLYTSGSTGQPKAAIHCHKNMVATAANFAGAVLQLRGEDRTLSMSKLFFAYGLGNGMYFPFSVGASTILNSEQPTFSRTAELVSRYRPTLFFGVPTHFKGILRDSGSKSRIDFSSVRLAVSAGEPLPVDILNEFKDRFGVEILEGLGSTEMLQNFISNRPNTARPGTCGYEVPNYEARLVGEDGADVPLGDVGALWAKGHSQFLEYWKRPELTARTIRDGWVLTGDRFYRDMDGFMHFCGRSDDMMKISGMWVSPVDIAAALRRNPNVEETIVVGREDLSGNKTLCAYVTMKGDGTSAPALRRYLYEALPQHMVPHHILIVPNFPLTSNGKIDRAALPIPIETAIESHSGVRECNGERSTEGIIAGIWENVLRTSGVTPKDNFFDLGGDSLTAVRCLGQIRDTFGIDLTLDMLFAEDSTLKTIADAVDNIVTSKSSVPKVEV